MTFYMIDNLCTAYKLRMAHLARCLETIGWERSASRLDADVRIIGMCAAFHIDQMRSINMAWDSVSWGKATHLVGCAVRGCPAYLPRFSLAQRWTANQFRELALALGVSEETFDAVPVPTQFLDHKDWRVYDSTRHFLVISWGCAFECSFCPHRIGMGSLQSRPIEEVLWSARRAVQEGAKTLVLTGLDTASYGIDRGQRGFQELLRTLLDVDATEKWNAQFHVAQFNPEGLTPGIVALFCDPRIVDVQLPIQTTCRYLLRLIGRHYDPKHVLNTAWKIKLRNPRMRLRTDLIVGYPGETTSALWRSVHAVSVFKGWVFEEVAVYGFEGNAWAGSVGEEVKRIPQKEIDRRVIMASDWLRKTGILVHHGGQDPESLRIVDQAKGTCHAPEYKESVCC